MDQAWIRYGSGMNLVWLRYESGMDQVWVRYGSDMDQVWSRFGSQAFIGFCHVLEHPGDFTLVFVTSWSFGSALVQLRVTFGSGMAEVGFSLRFPTTRGLEVIFHLFL